MSNHISTQATVDGLAYVRVVDHERIWKLSYSIFKGSYLLQFGTLLENQFRIGRYLTREQATNLIIEWEEMS
jgi:hypothetical protein